MTCVCARPLEINEQTMTCSDGEAHIREVLRIRVQDGWLDLLMKEEDEIVREILLGVVR